MTNHTAGVLAEAIDDTESGHRPSLLPAHRLGALRATWEAVTVGLDYRGGVIARFRGQDITRVRMGTRRFVALTHPEYVDHVLHAGRLKYNKSFDYETLRSVLGTSLLTDEGDSWQHHRTMLNPIFAKRHLNDLVDLMIEPIQAAVDELDARGERVEFDMVDQMVELTLNVVGTALFSQQFGRIAEGMSGMATRALRFAERLERVFLVAAPPTDVFRALARVRSSRLPIPSPLPRIDALMKSFDSAVWSVVNERNTHRTDTPDLLNHLLNARSEDGAPLPLRRVRDEALTFMLAGHETTANALSWMWYLLALNPDVRAKMLAEVDDVLAGRRPTVDDLAALPWTQACFQEAMRYFSPAWAIPRVAIEDDVIGGHHIRKGTTVIIPVHLVHHDDRWWSNPEEYDPSRFLPGCGKGRPRSAYLPFGGGKRICIGSSFALMESVLITAMMSQQFTFDLVPGHPVDPEATLTLRPRHGVKMIARRRKATA